MVQAEEFSWFSQISQGQQELIKLSEYLCQREKMSQVTLIDYGFIIFPAAKAYEGFLKQYLYDLGLISQHTFESNRFRIGRALNPDIRETQQDEFWLYDNLEQLCGKNVSEELWQTWLLCRNKIVHYFPLETHKITLGLAEERIEMVLKTMDMAHHCKLTLALPKSNNQS